MKQRIVNLFFMLFLTALYAFIIMTSTEWLYSGSAQRVIERVKLDAGPFLYGWLFLFLLLGGFRVFKRKVYIPLISIICVFALSLGYGSRMKQNLRGEPMIPSDLAMFSEAKSMLDILSANIMTVMIVSVVIYILILAFLIYKVPNENIHWIPQVMLALLFSIAFSFLFLGEAKQGKTSIATQFNSHYIRFNQVKNYETNGVLVSFTRNLKWLAVEEPPLYSEKYIKALKEKYEDKEFARKSDQTPNIIMIQSEAYWDPTVLNGVTFNQDPLPFYRSIKDKHTSGSLLAPVFGGSTANTEFEVLTGLSMQFLPSGTVPFLHSLKKPIPALPNILTKSGYETTAIHSYANWFYQRNNVYHLLGFDRFISGEYLKNPTIDYTYYKDDVITDTILEQLDKSEKPDFIFAVTMQNHMPYAPGVKKSYATIEVSSEKLTEDSKGMLEFYGDTLVQVDYELERLITTLNERNEPTIIVYYGDHLPTLGNDYKVYREAGYYKEDGTYDEYKKMYETPLLIWDNFSNNREKLHLSSSFLGAYVLDKAGVKGNVWTDFLQHQLQNQITKIPRADYFKDEGLTKRALNEYELLQYDIYYGKQYVIDDAEMIQPNDTYRLGYVDPVIKNVTVSYEASPAFAQIKGEYFTKSTQAFINGERVETIFESPEALKVEVDAHKKMTIQVKVLDDLERVLSTSNQYDLNGK
ncbi:LTA synthase family protein [Bacillus sp. CGMCC 1.16541]|uniref:LTA synthase family protein n=1 Tax=Bacillus sp. CGMCC 1.16541 TaxID=2185143 RepID=UPI000D72CDD8|nr:LTA synthase family protein [Bacillus sp. CGMCC 1.16541]